MFILFFILLLFTFLPSGFNDILWFSWVNMNFTLIIFQLFLIFATLKLFFSKNIYEMLLWSFLNIFTLVIGLFIYQLDVFACFLLISETVVIFFILTFIIHVNHNNMHLSKSKSYITILIILFLALFINFFYYNSSNYSYYTDWYTSQLSSYNDLLSQYIYIYTINNYLMLLVGSWLLLLTFFLVIVLTTSTNSSSLKETSFNYFFKKQNMWKQWSHSPFLKFFK